MDVKIILEKYYPYFENTREAFVPPNPKLLVKATLTVFSCAMSGI